MSKKDKATLNALSTIVAKVKSIRERPTYFPNMSLDRVAFVDGGDQGNRAVIRTNDDTATSALPLGEFDIIAMIPRSGAFMSPDGTMAIKSSLYSKDIPFEKTKLKWNLAAPDHPLLSVVSKDDWPNFLANVAAVQRLDSHFDHTSPNFNFTAQVDGAQFTIIHNLLVVSDSNCLC